MLLDPSINSRDPNLLESKFSDQAQAVKGACAARGVKMVFYFTVRGPIVQAKLYCQSRTVEAIKAKREEMIAGGAGKLAAMLKDEYAASGKWATNCPPGLSWHQYATASDSFVVGEKGEADWKSPAYKTVYAVEAKKIGLTAGAFWPGKSADPDHIQSSPLGGPMTGTGGLTWSEVEKKMEELYGI